MQHFHNSFTYNRKSTNNIISQDKSYKAVMFKIGCHKYNKSQHQYKGVPVFRMTNKLPSQSTEGLNRIVSQYCRRIKTLHLLADRRCRSMNQFMKDSSENHYHYEYHLLRQMNINTKSFTRIAFKLKQ